MQLIRQKPQHWKDDGVLRIPHIPKGPDPNQRARANSRLAILRVHAQDRPIRAAVPQQASELQDRKFSNAQDQKPAIQH